MITENDLFIERAAILEFDAGFDRDIAYRKAFSMLNHGEWVAICKIEDSDAPKAASECFKYAKDNNISELVSVVVEQRFVGIMKKNT